MSSPKTRMSCSKNMICCGADTFIRRHASSVRRLSNSDENTTDNELIFKGSSLRCDAEIKIGTLFYQRCCFEPHFTWGLACFSTLFPQLTLPLQKLYNPLFSGFSVPRFHVKGRGPDVTTSPLAERLSRIITAGGEEVLWKWTRRQQQLDTNSGELGSTLILLQLSSIRALRCSHHFIAGQTDMRDNSG